MESGLIRTDDVIRLVGPLLLGYLLNWMLLGILIIQVYSYSQAGFDDKLITRLLVYGVLVFELLQSVLMAHDAFKKLAFGWGQNDALVRMDCSWLSLPVITGLASAAIQCYYAWRIYGFSGSKIIPSIIISMAVVQCASGCAGGIFAEINDTDDVLDVQTQLADVILSSLWVGFRVASDIVITVSMVYYLTRSRTGIRRTNALINTLIVYVVQTGLATTVLSTAEMALFFTSSDRSVYYFPASAVVSKVYSNALLVLLNDRPTIQARGLDAISSAGFGRWTEREAAHNQYAYV